MTTYRLAKLPGFDSAPPAPWLAFPPLDAISLTSSVGRLAKLPGLFAVPDMVDVLGYGSWLVYCLGGFTDR